jgi:HEAT repeat protein
MLSSLSVLLSLKKFYFARASVRGISVFKHTAFKRFNVALGLALLLVAPLVAAPKSNAKLKNADKKVREQAVIEIGRDKTNPAAAEQILPLAMNDPDLGVRAAAIQSLGNQRAHFSTLKTLLSDSTQPLVVRQASASAIALFSDPDAQEFLVAEFQKAEGELKEHIGLCLEGGNAQP